jgi:hypothetical protein
MLDDLEGCSDLPSLQILESELAEFRRTGRKVHLLHAARALDEAQGEMRAVLTRELQPIYKPSKGEHANER